MNSQLHEAMLHQIRECFEEFTRESSFRGQSLIYIFITSRDGRFKINKIINIFKEQTYKIALQYNNLFNYNHEEYNLKTNQMKVMCFHLNNFTSLNDIDNIDFDHIINRNWIKAHEVRLCGCISVVKKLPAGNPPFIGRLISSYLYEEEVARFNEIH